MFFHRKTFLLLLLSLLISSCASVEPEKIEKQGFDEGREFMTVQAYELLVRENYELLLLMDEEGDTGPSRHRNLIVGRLNSALYHLGAMIKEFSGRKEWSPAVIQHVSAKGYAKSSRRFAKALKVRWKREWKTSFEDEDPQGYRLLALETYIKYGNAFGIEGF